MAIAGTNIRLDSTEGMDKITSTEKVTSPYFSNGDTDLLAANIITTSLSDTNENYFFGISNSSTPTVAEFNVTFGSTNGYGSTTTANKKNVTTAIYKHYASTLLTPTEVTGGFFISSPASSPAISSGKDEEIFVLSARRSNMKDRLNKGSWLIALSGSTSANGNTPADVLHLKDDSVNDTPTATPVGDRYNIVSCSSAGVIATQATDRNFGFFYPDMGILVFSAAELSASIPGTAASASQAVKFGSGADATTGIGHLGFGNIKTAAADTNQALRFPMCLQANATKLSFRDEEDQVSAQYFCRVRSGHANFSNNPTFVSGSLNELRQTKMKDNPQTFITSVQLYNQTGDMVAVGQLSTPLKKNFQSEATIKVKLTY